MPKVFPAAGAHERHIFINCPFDKEYKPIFDALVFATFDCGYVPRCALEIDNAAHGRIEKILKIIRQCPLGVHDISRTELDTEHQLPRFNMPFELGLFLGAARFSSPRHHEKCCLILDRERFRYQKFISDIAGQDIRAHNDEPVNAITQLRAWFSTLPGQRVVLLPGGADISSRYIQFREELPAILINAAIAPEEMEFADYTNIVSVWLRQHPR